VKRLVARKKRTRNLRRSETWSPEKVKVKGSVTTSLVSKDFQRI